MNQKNIAFSSYEKMPTSLKKLTLSQNQYAELDKIDWVVTEKIHGANFCFIYENGNLFYGKRKENLVWNDDFFGFQLVVNKLENQILSLFEELSQNIESQKYIIYGELFGGVYPHSEVEKKENLEAIQTGIYYSNTIEFCAFDIAFENNKVKAYLDYKKAIELFKKHEILYAKNLFIGKLNKALEFDIRINSTLPKLLNLPKLETNLVEGIVIKPFEELNQNLFPQRPILKVKNSEFEENEIFHQAKKWSYIPKLSSNTEELHFLVEEIRNYVTQNRLQSAISKIGSLDFDNLKRIKEIENEFLRDILTDFDENNDAILKELSNQQKNWIEERIKVDCSKIMNTQK
ncbi:RNA ligase [Bernardetia litoralis DSM 6794]|uniref:RNA ligase n=1 Tax=Bernardetia litoralis (strain ATCC 23117 / DSM 6794 / NBRC 15988 / NCIMB 1366 / Fx l1 / Sio-4) TaxID=880071 RepID=I4AL26_BERLS|nr:RNA ligase family protein [Bernardetia litoralis]AFM04661.1 RNA ligase [Bernardetia litoralis DSM 6794]